MRSARTPASRCEKAFRPRLEVLEDRTVPAVVSRAPAAIVNTTTPGNQNSPAVAMDANGDTIVVWKDAAQEVSPTYESDIMAQRYNPAGARCTRTAPRPGHKSSGSRPRRPPSSSSGTRRPWRWTPTATSSSSGPGTTPRPPATTSTKSRAASSTPPARPSPATSPLPQTTIRSGAAPPSRWTRAATGWSPGRTPSRPPTTSTPSGTASTGPRFP